MKKIVSIVLLFWVMSTHSQEKIPFVDSQQIFTLVREAAQKREFQTSVDLLSRISPNDSVYLPALKDKSYYLLQLEKYQEAIDVANLGIANETRNESKSTFYINKAVALIQLQQYDASLSILEEALTKYPVNSLLYYNKGVALDQLGKMEEAMHAYQESLFYAPFYAPAHLRLGNICYRQGSFAKALMAFNIYILMEYENNPLQALSSLNKLVQSKFPEKTNTTKDDPYQTIDLILNSHIALNERYVIDNEITIALNKQNHALLTEINKLPVKGDFWAEHYVPLFQWIQNNNLYNNFTYTISASINNEDYKNVIEKKEKEIQEFVSSFYSKWTELMQKRTLLIDGKNVDLYYNYNNDDEVSSYGPIQNDKAIGLWRYFYDSGELRASGMYDENEERDQTWTWYFLNGKVDETTNYSHGKMEGRSVAYHNNGQLRVDSQFKNNAFDGKYEYFELGGALSERKYFTNGLLNGSYRSYFAVGELMPEFETNYQNDSISGSLIEYYRNGNVYRESTYEKGLLTQEKDYYTDGTLWSERNYKDSKLDGAYRVFYKNKQIAQDGTAVDDAFDGPYKVYFVNGQLDRDFTYDKGKIEGSYKAYDTDGKLYYDYTYRNGELIGYVFYDKKGNVLKEAKKKGGEFEYEGYNANGSLSAKGMYDVSGGRKGLWKFYSPYGVLTEQGTYIEDQPDGEYTYFFDDGTIKSKVSFEKGQQTGYSVEYYNNGKMKQQGWYKDGVEHGDWMFYRKDGSLSSTSYFYKGSLNGKSVLYTVEGKISSEVYFEFGNNVKEVIYEADGTANVFWDLYKGTGTETLKTFYNNGSVESSYTYVNKVKHGPYKRYNIEGQLLAEGNYTNNELDGLYKSYDDFGTLRSEYTYLNGNLHGEQKLYHENGTLSQLDFYDYGESHKADVSYYNNGVISHERNYVYGKMHGKFAFYDISKRLQLIRYYQYGELVGYSYLDTNGKEVDMIPLKHGSGKLISYYDNGQVSREMEFLNGKLVNNYKAYYYDGTLENEIQFVENLYNGLVTEYHANGKIKLKENYLLGDQHGPSQTYYDNGQLKQSVNYLHNVLSGLARYYSKEGKLIKEINYVNGKQVSVKNN